MAGGIREDPILGALLRCRITLLNVAARFVGSDLAGEVVNDVCVRVLKIREEDRPSAMGPRGEIKDFDRYIYAMVRNHAIDRARSLSIEKRRSVTTEEPLDIASKEPTPEDLLIMRQQYEILIGGLSSLPPRTRQAFEMRRFDGLKLRDISHVLGISFQRAAQLIEEAENELATILPDLVKKL